MSIKNIESLEKMNIENIKNLENEAGLSVSSMITLAIPYKYCI